MSEPNTLKDLKSLMLFFGRIPETHVQNLKAAPFIYFDSVKQAGLTYELDTKATDWFVMYELTTDKEPDSLAERAKALETAIRMLFWKEVVLILNINGKTVYKSKGLVPNE